MTDFQKSIIEGIPDVLPEPKPFDPTVNHAPHRKQILTADEKKLALICTAAVGNAPVSNEFKRFINLVLKNRREDILQYIILSYRTLYHQKKHIGTAKLITAIPVSTEVEERIRQAASSILHAHMELESEVDPKIEGGFIFDINDYRLDASIATQFKKVKRQFIDKNRRIV